jgi:hypothetical protein
MVELYKMIDGKLVFFDHGILQRKHDYELRGYYVRVVKPGVYRHVPKRGEILCTHMLHKQEWTMADQITGVVCDIKSVCRFIKGLFTPVKAYQLAGAYSM